MDTKTIERYKLWTKSLGLKYDTKYVGETEVADIDEKKKLIKFYFSTFGVIDSYKEITGNGAFTKTIKENISRVKHLKNHDKDMAVGKVREIGVDTKGAWMLSEFVNTQKSLETFEEYVKEMITEHSYGYDVIKSHNEKMGGENIVILDEVRLWEASSLTGWGANWNTPVIELLKHSPEEVINIVKEFSDENKKRLIESINFGHKEIEETIAILKRNLSL